VPLIVLVFLGLATQMGCSGVFEEVAPPEKDKVLLVFVPDFVRRGDVARQVDAFLDVPATGTFVTAIDMGPGIEVVAFDSRNNQGCGPLPTPPEFEGREPFRLCISLQIQATADIGERIVTIQVRSAGEPLVGETSFFVLRELQ